MNYYRCSPCGKTEVWSSYGAPRCVKCKDCGGTLGCSPSDHHPLEPHQFGAWTWVIEKQTGARSQVRRCDAMGCGLKETRTEAEAMADSHGAEIDG